MKSKACFGAQSRHWTEREREREGGRERKSQRERERGGESCCEVKWLVDMWGVPTYGNEKVPCTITIMPV
jgi:hypothetical protein